MGIQSGQKHSQLTGQELVRAVKHLDLHRDAIIGATITEVMAHLSNGVGRNCTDANTRYALEAAGLYEEWKAARKRRILPASATKRESRARAARIDACETVLRRVCTELGIACSELDDAALPLFHGNGGGK